MLENRLFLSYNIYCKICLVKNHPPLQLRKEFENTTVENGQQNTRKVSIVTDQKDSLKSNIVVMEGKIKLSSLDEKINRQIRKEIFIPVKIYRRI